jgi:hypothetical protein
MPAELEAALCRSGMDSTIDDAHFSTAHAEIAIQDSGRGQAIAKPLPKLVEENKQTKMS